MSIDELKTLKREAIRAKYPTIPDHAIAVPKYSDKTSNGLTKMICDFIRLHGGQAERINSMGIYDPAKRHWRPSGSRKGTADISGIFRGKSLKIEVKIGHDRLSIYQVEYGREVIAAGGLYFVATSFEQFTKWINKTFNL